MLSEVQVEMIRECAERLAESNTSATNAFYSNLFREVPSVRHLFPEDMFRQSEKLWNSIVMIVESADDLDGIQGTLRELGARHVEYGALPEHYEIVSDILIKTISSLLGEDWTEAHNETWRATMIAVCGTMLEGASARGA